MHWAVIIVVAIILGTAAFVTVVIGVLGWGNSTWVALYSADAEWAIVAGAIFTIIFALNPPKRPGAIDNWND